MNKAVLAVSFQRKPLPSCPSRREDRLARVWSITNGDGAGDFLTCSKLLKGILTGRRRGRTFESHHLDLPFSVTPPRRVRMARRGRPRQRHPARD